MNQQGQPTEEHIRKEAQSDMQPAAMQDGDAGGAPYTALGAEIVSPDQFHEMLQQRPGDEQQPAYGQAPSPQYQPQYGQPGQSSYGLPPVQQHPSQSDYRPGNQPASPPQYAVGDYRPDQPPQYREGGYYPPQQQHTPHQPQPYYMGGQPPGPPSAPPQKRGMPAWAWVLPLIIILLAAGGFGTWFYLSAQERAASDARATSTAVAQANALSTAQVARTATAVAGKAKTAVAQTTPTAEAESTVAEVETSIPTSIALQASPTAATAIEPIRMPVDQFMALYSDPAKRPMIVDVRSKASYDQGHIVGAVSIPDDETEARLSEFPKDRLIIAYCQ